MEPFFIDDEFHSDLDDYISRNDWVDEDIEALPDDWREEVLTCKMEPVFQIKPWIAKEITERLVEIHYDRLPENLSDLEKRIAQVILSGIDVDKINAALPCLWYPDGGTNTITKADLLDHIK